MSTTPTSHASTRDLVTWRMRALGLWHPLPGTAMPGASGEDRITAVIHGLFAVQGQDWAAARWALGVRAAGTVEADVLDAFDSGALVRSWPMRGTIHVLAAEDIGWIQAATGRRVLAGAPRRRENLGLDDRTLTRMVDIAIERMTGGRSLSRDELSAAWVDAGIGDAQKGVGPWRYHVVWWLCQNGIAVPGPVRTENPSTAPHPSASAKPMPSISEPRLVLAEEWIRSPRTLEGDEALAELAVRFARGRGPVQDRDLAWWTGLALRESRRGIAVAEAEGRLAPVQVEGVTYWADPRLLEATSDSPASPALLLPSFDEHLLGYTDRSAVLDPRHFERVVPGRNGVFRATVVDSQGRTIGTWLRERRAQHTRITVEAFADEATPIEELHDAAAAWAAFHGTEVDINHR